MHLKLRFIWDWQRKKAGDLLYIAKDSIFARVKYFQRKSFCQLYFVPLYR